MVRDQKVNPEFYMEIDETINNWLEQCIQNLEKETIADTEQKLVYDLCHASLRITNVYYNSIIKLLKEGIRLPTKALLRTLAELASRLTWCLHSKAFGRNSTGTRIASWNKLSNRKYLNLIENSMSIIHDKNWAKEQLKKAGQEKKCYEKNNMPEMPEKFEDICKSLSKKHKDFLRPALYLQFHHAVHIDAYLLRKFINESQLKDTLEKIEELKVYCLVCVYFVISSVYSYWNWSLGEIRKEYQQICNALGCDINIENIFKNKQNSL